MVRTINIELPDESYQILSDLASQVGLSAEQMATEWLLTAANELQSAMEAASATGPIRTRRRKKPSAEPSTSQEKASEGKSIPATSSICQLKVTLRDIRPPIWRRILVLSDTSLAKLHGILQVVMGWEDDHLHQFEAGGNLYGIPDDFDFGPRVRNESRVKLSQAAPAEKSRLIYEYDFGDGWDHDILVEKILPPEEGVRYPVCIKGKRAGPPEDVGGAWGYEGFLEAISNPDHPEHDEMLEWAGGSFDPEAFDIDAINKELRKIR